MIKNISLATALTVVALASSAIAAETQDASKPYYFQLNTGGSYGTVPKGDFSDKSKSGWSPLYGLEVGYKFNDELQLFLSPSMTVEEFNSIRNGHIEKLNEIVTWYTSYLTSSHYNGLAVERKDQIRTWADEIFSIVPTEIEKLNNNNSCVLSYIIPFTEILETRPNIEFEV